MNKTAERRQDRLRHHHLFQRDHGLLAGHREDADDGLLAILCRDCGYTKIGVGGADRHREAAVLREARLGDVQVAQNFDARHERAVELARKREDLAQQTVDAEADA